MTTTKSNSNHYESESDNHIQREIQIIERDFPDIDNFEVRTSEDYHRCCEALKMVKSRSKSVEASRKEITKHLDAAKKQIMDKWRPITDKYKNMENVLKELIVKYDEMIETKRLQLESQISGNVPEQSIKHDGISKKTSWDYRIVDATKIPKEYLTIDHQKLKAACAIAKTEDGKPNTKFVKGVEFFKNVTVSVKAD